MSASELLESLKKSLPLVISSTNVLDVEALSLGLAKEALMTGELDRGILNCIGAEVDVLFKVDGVGERSEGGDG